MIVCPSCGNQSIQVVDGCSRCGFTPSSVDGFLAWAPELAKCNDGFPKDAFEALARVEEGSFWFRARNAIILWALRKYFYGFQSLLEVGCGTGFVLTSIVKEFPGIRVCGSEIYTAGLVHASERMPSVELFQMDARKLPFEAEFDVVCSFDVIEHILEDEQVLKNFYHAIKPGGGCLITVPQHRWLWSPIDVTACHQRRYTAKELHDKVRAAGFRIVRSTSFVSLLLPLMMASRHADRLSGSADGANSLELNPVLDFILEGIMRLELYLIKIGISLPIGGSRLVVLRRED